MYFYHGKKHYYLANIFLSDQNLYDALYTLDLTEDEYKDVCYALSDELLEDKDSSSAFSLLVNSSLSANEYYDEEINQNKKTGGQYTSLILSKIQQAIIRATGISYKWYSPLYKTIYIGVLKSCIYGSLKHFFYENREKYIPQYDWYLINSSPKRKVIMNTMFSEFDKLATIADALKYYQDPDDIPEEFLIRLQEITGLTLNTYSGVLSADQLRNLTKHLIDVWREKGSLYSIELFFACLGIDCALEELWFDRRLYYNTNSFNEYTKINSTREFGYYLTPKAPQSTTYTFSSENVDYAMYTAPMSSRLWDYTIKTSTSSESDTIRKLLGYLDSDLETTYTYFKSNYLLFNFDYIDQTKAISRDELAIFKEMVAYILPIYMRTIYVNDYGSDTGDEGLDVLVQWDMNSGASDNITQITTEDGTIIKPVEIFKLFDTQNAKGVTLPISQEVYDLEDRKEVIRDFYPPTYCGPNFVSGSFIIVNDTRFKYFMDANNVDYKTAATTSYVEMIDGNRFSSNGDNYPPFYDNEYHNYYYVNGELEKDDGQWYEAEDGSWIKSRGTVGELIITTENDEASDIEIDGYDENTKIHSTITHYFFKVNNEEPVEIFPNLFVESNNGSCVEFVEGYPGELFYIEVEHPIIDDLARYYEFIKTSDTTLDESKQYYVLEDGIYKLVNNPIGSELNLYYEFIKTSDTEIDPDKTYYILNFRDETFGVNIEPQVNFTYEIKEDNEYKIYPWDTFDQKYTEKPQNLFEASTWREHIPAINDLYNNGSWNGDIQYEYFDYSNPIRYLEAEVKSPITITLI